MSYYLKYISNTLLFMVCCFFISNAQVEVWVTEFDKKTKLLERSNDISFIIDTGVVNNEIIVVDTTEKYQVIDGFGATMTGSSAYVIDQMTPNAREKVMNSLFSEDGIRINFIRHSIGASDFNKKSSYTYCDLYDTRLSSFSIEKDKDYIIPILKEAIEKNNNTGYCIMGSPWSAPAWMKTSGSLNGGELKEIYEEIYAYYFLKYIKAYQNEGIPIYAITIQNEPDYTSNSYPTMSMTEDQTIRFVKNYLGPIFTENGLGTKIIAYDHNWDNYSYPIEVLNDPDANKYIAGSAFHAYGGWYTNQPIVHDAHPDKGIWFTEQTGHGSNYFHPSSGWGYDLYWSANNLFIGSIRNWSKCVLQWNIALDKDYGPKNGGCSDCRGLVTIDGDNYYKEPEYYSVGHFSKFVDRGAIRIGSISTSSSIYNVAFRNPDESIVLVVLNSWNSSPRKINIKLGDSILTDTLDSRTIKTYKWGGDPNYQYLSLEDKTSKENYDFNIYPNPSDGMIYISGISKKVKNIVISDIHGKIVYKKQGDFEKNITINVEFLNKGIYFVNLISEDVNLTKKVVVN